MKKSSLKLLVLALSFSITTVASGCGSNQTTVTEDELAAIADPEEGRGDVIDEEDSTEASEDSFDSTTDELDDDELEAQPLDYTGYDTNGVISFTIYNNTPYDIYSAKVGSTTSSSDSDIDILPAILSPDDTYDFEAVLDENAWDVTDWTIFFTDTDGDTSQSYETFNAWNVAVINVTWDEENRGYVCDFLYYDEIPDESEDTTDENPLVKGDATITTEEIVAWNMYFTVNNLTPFEILAIKMGPASGNSDGDVDILGEKTLPSNNKLDVEATLSPEWREVTEWTLYITDVDGDTSAYYETFDPWEVLYVDINWDSNSGSYYCDFVY